MEQSEPTRKPYRSPQFDVYGEIRNLARENPLAGSVLDNHPSNPGGNRKTN